MLYFSGFSLKNEEQLFDFWLNKSNYTVAGFSYGAIKALKYTLNSKNRVDRLILLSPAYFNNKRDAFKKMQLLYFKKDSKKYIENFLKNITNNSSLDLTKFLKEGSVQELKELLYFNWDIEDLKTISKNGTTIEVILAQKDKIIDSKEALKFFEQVAKVYYIKDANHILKEIDSDN